MACYLRLNGTFPTSSDAFEFIIERRAGGERGWVSVAHKRYLYYFDELMDRLEAIRKVSVASLESQTAGYISPTLQAKQSLLAPIESSASIKLMRLRPLPNSQERLYMKKAVVNLGWNADDVLLERLADYRLGLEVYQGSKLVWSSEINSLDTPPDSPHAQTNGPIEFFTGGDLLLSGDFQIKIMLQIQDAANLGGPGMDLIPLTVSRRRISRLTIATYTAHCAFVSADRRLRLRHVDMETVSSTLSQPVATMTNGFSLKKIGEAFWMDLYFSREPSDNGTVTTDAPPSPEQTRSATLSLHKIVMNTVPNFDGRGSCNPELEVWRIGATTDMLSRQRELCYSSTDHREQIRARSSFGRGSGREGAQSRSSMLTIESQNSISTLGSDSTFDETSLRPHVTEDPVYLDSFMIIFRLSDAAHIAAGTETPTKMSRTHPLDLDPMSLYEIKIFHVDDRTAARVPICRFEFAPSLMAPGLIRIRHHQ